MHRTYRLFLSLWVILQAVVPQAEATVRCQLQPYPTIWVPDGTRITSTAARPQRAIVITDPVYGLRVLWPDLRDPSRTMLYSRRVEDAGRLFWAESRFSLSPSNEDAPNIAAAPERSLLAVWSDNRDDEGDIYTQRISAGGTTWPSFVVAGIPICTAPGKQSHPTVAFDGEGGFFAVWVDERFGLLTSPDIYIQRFHDYGLIWEGWPLNGVPLCALPGEQRDPVVVSDGAGGALVVFRDAADPYDQNLRMARISGAGVVPAGWANGKPMTVSTADAGAPIVMAEPTGGAFVAWPEVTVRGANPEMGIRLTRVTSAGQAAPGWDLEGESIGTVQGVTGTPTLAGDGQGGVFVGWVEAATLAVPEAKATRLLGDGAVAAGWVVNGRILGPATSINSAVALLGDQGFVFAAWTDPSEGATIRALRLDRVGATAEFWPARGVAMSAAPGGKRIDSIRPGDPTTGSIVSDGVDGALVFWIDERDGSPAIYGQRISANGVIAPRGWEGSPCDKSGWIVRTYPVPTRGALTVDAFAPADRRPRMSVYDVRGRLRHVAHLGAIPGPAVLPFQLDLSSLAPGVYFLNYEFDGDDGTSHGSRRIIVAR